MAEMERPNLETELTVWLTDKLIGYGAYLGSLGMAIVADAGLIDDRNAVHPDTDNLIKLGAAFGLAWLARSIHRHANTSLARAVNFEPGTGQQG